MTVLTVALAIVAVVVGWTALATLAAWLWALAATRYRRRPSRAQLHARLAESRRVVGELTTKSTILLAANEALAAENAELRAYAERCVAWLTADLRRAPTAGEGGDL